MGGKRQKMAPRLTSLREGHCLGRMCECMSKRRGRSPGSAPRSPRSISDDSSVVGGGAGLERRARVRRHVQNLRGKKQREREKKARGKKGRGDGDSRSYRRVPQPHMAHSCDGSLISKRSSTGKNFFGFTVLSIVSSIRVRFCLWQSFWLPECTFQFDTLWELLLFRLFRNCRP